MAAKVKVRRIGAKVSPRKTVTVPAWVAESGKPGPTLLLTAAQHGNEVQGSEAIRRFIEIARRGLAAGKVIAVPFANIPALRERRPHIRMAPEQPYADHRGHNMNRTWPGSGRNETARLSRAIYDAFGEEATHCLDLHCWERRVAPAVLLRDVPGARELARKLGHRFVHVSRPDAKSHTIAAHFCRTGRLGVTYEFSGQYVVREAEVLRGLRVVKNMARAIGLLRGRLEKGEPPVLFSDECATREVASPATGLFVESGLAPLEKVRRGQKLGHILSEGDLGCREVVAPVSGYLGHYGAMRPDADVALPDQHPYVERGERLAVITWRKARR